MFRSLALLIMACCFFNAYSQADFASVKNEINFAPNRGQVLNSNGETATDVLAKASVPGMDLYLTTHGLSYVFLNYEEDKDAPVHSVFINEKQHKIHYSRVDVDLVGATLTATQMQWAQPTITKTNHYYGNIRVENLQHYQQVTIANVYPGIDWVWKVKDNQQLEYDFVVHPQADASVIKMEYRYATPEVAPTYLKIHTKNGGLTEGELLAYNAGERVPVTYALNGNAVSFNIPAYDKSQPFVIDPPLFLDWQALYGGSYADALRAVTTDAQGNIYMAGYSTSPNFPVWNGVPGAYFDGTLGGGKDAVVIKTSSTPNLQWATYLGGNNIDVANSVTVDAQGRVYVAGLAGGNFPLQFGAGNFNTGVVTAGGFITRFSPSLTMQWSSGIGGNGVHEALKVYTDSRSNIWVTGYTNGGFPVYNNAQFAYNSASGFTNNVDAFAMLFDTLNNVKWSAIYGGSGDDYAASCVTDTMGQTYVVGFTGTGGLPAGNALSPGLAYGGSIDGFIWEPRSNRRAYLGGSSNDFIFDITATKNNLLFVTGRTQSPNFPVQQNNNLSFYQGTQAGYYDVFITRFSIKTYNNNTLGIDWSTYYGGATNDETATGIACDKDNRVYITGFTASTDFPVQAATQPGAFYQGTKGGQQDAFIAGFSMTGKRFWSTYRGGTCPEFANDIACSTTPNKVYVVGEGLYACNVSVPDSAAIGSGGSASGFVWAFDGASSSCPEVSFTNLVVPCPEQCNGSATVSITGGQAPVSILWASGETTATVNVCGYASGSASPTEVVVVDDYGCSAELETELPAVSAFINAVAPITCYDDGVLYGQTYGGTPPLTLGWGGNGITGYYDSTITASEAGYYQFGITDANGCVSVYEEYLDYDNTPASAVVTVIQQPTCGENNGIIAVTSSMSGSPLFTWTINGVPSAFSPDTIYNAAPGTYEIDTSYAECYNGQFLHAPTVLYPSSALVASALIVPVSCLGNNGAVYVTVGGGVQPYYFSWSNGSTDVNLPSLTDGNMQYGMLVTDDNGCTLDTSFFVPYADFTPQVLITVLRNPGCGLNNGLLVARNLQGQPVVTDWILPDNSIIYTDTVFNAAPGNYSLNNGYCVNGVYTQQTVFVPDSSNIQVVINVTQVPVNCIVNNGSLEAGVASNDNPPYTYAWSNGSNIGLAVNLEPGQSYTVTVTDNLGCSATATHTFAPGQGPLITATNMVPVTCANDTNGQLSLSLIGGGGPPYSFTWSNGATTTTATGLAEGQYRATVSGANGCPTVSNVIVLERLNANLVDFTTTAPSCGQANGSITATGLSGAQPLKYDWSTGDFGPTLSGLNAGVYTVSVTPNVGLAYTACVRFYPSINVQAPVTVVPLTCQGATTVTATPTGGLAPYSILWNNGETGFSFAQTTSDTVRAVVTDSLGCTYSIEEYVTVTPALDVTYNQTPILCYGGTSTVQIAATGGVPTYTGTGTFTLPAGTYSYIVTDNGGCADTADFIVDEPTELEAVYAATPIACNGGTTIISVVAGGGTPAYTGEGNFTRPAGNYSFIVTDARGCKDTVAVSLTQPTDLTTTVTPPATFNCDAPISVTVNSTGGTPPYTGTGTVSVTPNTNANIIVTDNAGCKDTTTYNLTLPQGLSTTITGADTICKGQNVVFTASGNFDFTWQGNVTTDTLTLNNVQNTTTVIVQGTSPEGCVVNDTITLVAELCIGINEVANATWHVYPNPATNQFVIEWNGMNNLQAYRLFANDGKLVSETKLDATQQSTVVDCSHFAAGVYVLQLQTNGNTFYKKLVIEK